MNYNASTKPFWYKTEMTDEGGNTYYAYHWIAALNKATDKAIISVNNTTRKFLILLLVNKFISPSFKIYLVEYAHVRILILKYFN